ncbi:MAG: family 20 glycosylhydrolase [Clostridia bacterium]|nr:family 20 glycosylhydrolase [Clostridia bacterium]
MLHLIPAPKKLIEVAILLKKKSLTLMSELADSRLQIAIEKLPLSKDGIPLSITYGNQTGEGYTLTLTNEKAEIIGESAQGAFYGIQTLRQIFTHDEITELTISDTPDMGYRGFYHDTTRGKVPKVETLKMLIDQMAYYKLNSLQFYVEHSFDFKEYAGTKEKTGYFTAEEIKELDDYCYENFIEFIPSLSCFGHLFELLEQPEYKHLRELDTFEQEYMTWWERMAHHTIDPTNPESFELIKSLIDQYMPLFRSNKFNICCDETFDLQIGRHWNQNAGNLYIEFVKKLVAYLQSKGKTVMMWADILLHHPEVISELPADGVEYLNWWYEPEIHENDIELFEKMKKPQIVCPATWSWEGVVEWVEKEEGNICNMINAGYRHGAKGVLNTNWGDFGNPCTIELALYGMVLGGAKGWTVATEPTDEFKADVNHLLYENEKGYHYLRTLSDCQKDLRFTFVANAYSNTLFTKKRLFDAPSPKRVEEIRTICKNVMDELSNQTWKQDEFRKQMIISAEGIIVMDELLAKVADYSIERMSDTKAWLEKFSEDWLKKNKKSELDAVMDIFLTLDKTYSK